MEILWALLAAIGAYLIAKIASNYVGTITL